MKPFTRVEGPAAPLIENDINTDQIAPAGHGHRTLNPDYAEQLFSGRRGGSETFVLDRPEYRNAAILVTGSNFGCGSSRESAVWAVAASGIRCIVAESFADIYRDNCLKNGVLPVVLSPQDNEAFRKAVLADAGGSSFSADLESQRLTTPDGRFFPFEMPASEREILLKGLDDIGLTEIHLEEIEDWEARTRAERPWLQELKDANARP